MDNYGYVVCTFRETRSLVVEGINDHVIKYRKIQLLCILSCHDSRKSSRVIRSKLIRVGAVEAVPGRWAITVCWCGSRVCTGKGPISRWPRGHLPLSLRLWCRRGPCRVECRVTCALGRVHGSIGSWRRLDTLLALRSRGAMVSGRCYRS